MKKVSVPDERLLHLSFQLTEKMADIRVETTSIRIGVLFFFSKNKNTKYIYSLAFVQHEQKGNKSNNENKKTQVFNDVDGRWRSGCLFFTETGQLRQKVGMQWQLLLTHTDRSTLSYGRTISLLEVKVLKLISPSKLRNTSRKVHR